MVEQQIIWLRGFDSRHKLMVYVAQLVEHYTVNVVFM